MVTYKSSDSEIVLLQIAGHPELYRDEQLGGQHRLFGTCTTCKNLRPFDRMFSAPPIGECCNSCLNHLALARMEQDSENSGRESSYDVYMREFYPTNLSNAVRAQVFARDGHACRYYGAHGEVFIDHVLPQSRGSSHALDNLVTACRSCNSRKHDSTPEEAGMPLRPLAGGQA